MAQPDSILPRERFAASVLLPIALAMAATLVAVAAFKRMRARWKKPQASADDFAAAMERGGLPATAQRLREAAELI